MPDTSWVFAFIGITSETLIISASGKVFNGFVDLYVYWCLYLNLATVELITSIVGLTEKLLLVILIVSTTLIAVLSDSE